MAKSNFTAEQISNILTEAAPRGSTASVARKYGISAKTIINWRQRFKNNPTSDAIKTQKALEAENNRLKKIVANMAMDIELLKEVNAKKW
jgi:putative transposase